MSVAYCCEVCAAAEPHWNITRIGDVVTTWACDPHLAQVCDRLQRDHEVTELVVVDSRKSREWAGISRLLEQVARDGP